MQKHWGVKIDRNFTTKCGKRPVMWSPGVKDHASAMEVPYYSLMRFLWFLMSVSLIIFITLNFSGFGFREFIEKYGNGSMDSKKIRKGADLKLIRGTKPLLDSALRTHRDDSNDSENAEKVLTKALGKSASWRRNLNFNVSLAQDSPLSKFLNRVKIRNLSLEIELVRKHAFYFPEGSVLNPRKMSRSKVLESKLRKLDKILQEDSDRGLISRAEPLTLAKYWNILKKKQMGKRQVNEDGYFIVVNGDRNSDYIVPLFIDDHPSGDNLVIPEKGRRHYYVVPHFQDINSANEIVLPGPVQIALVALMLIVIGL